MSRIVLAVLVLLVSIVVFFSVYIEVAHPMDFNPTFPIQAETPKEKTWTFWHFVYLVQQQGIMGAMFRTREVCDQEYQEALADPSVAAILGTGCEELNLRHIERGPKK